MPTSRMLGPEANELVFLDPQKQFSSALGWGIVLDKLFPRGLMLLDFDEHRLHRRVLSVAFKADPMRSYLAVSTPASRKAWRNGRAGASSNSIRRSSN